jgi:23S rRNA (uracil1939-C5)-methyltransferase
VPVRYRNKTQVPFGTDREGHIIYGFYAGRTHAVIPCEDCLLGSAENKEILEIVHQWMEENHVQPYDETGGKGMIRHVLIRKGFHTTENEDLPGGKSLKRLKAGAGSPKQSLGADIMVCLVINGKKLPKKEMLCERLAAIPGMHSISISVNEENTNVIMGDTCETLWGESSIRDTICRWDEQGQKTEDGITYNISPLSFYQVNPVQTEKLYSTALRYAGLTGNETVWDLYCGIGTISLFLAKSAKQVYGVEIVPQAIADAKENAKQNGITNAQFFVGAAEEVLPAYYRGEMRIKDLAGNDAQDAADMRRPDVIVVDPPRKGCDIACLETMVQMQPQRIVYVSCDPATLARDVKYLREQGYELQRVRACDMFPNSFHVETAALLVR